MEFDIRENGFVLDKRAAYLLPLWAGNIDTDAKAQYPGQRMQVNAGGCHWFDIFIVPRPNLWA